MSRFPITKTPTLATYVSVLRKIGAPVDAGLRRARLPVLFEEVPEAWISYERLRFFTSDMAAREGIPELGLLPGSADLNAGLCKAVIEPVLAAPTLFRALQVIPSLVSRQTPDIRFWLKSTGDQVRACLLLPLPPEVPGYVVGETRTLGIIEGIIRTFVGQHFVPTRVLLASRRRDLSVSFESAYGGVPVQTDQPYGAIEFPRALLGSTNICAGPPRPGGTAGDAEVGEAPETLSETLEACLPPYLLEGYPHAALAAEIAGCGMRTLQRRLAKEGNTYEQIVDRVRCEAAISHLRSRDMQDIPLTHLSQRLGYSEHSAFTRAFRRWTGTSPSAYRAGVHAVE